MEQAIEATSEENNQLFIPMGGDGLPGYESVASFFKSISFEAYSDVWIASGSGTTAFGLAASLPSNVLLHIVLPGLEPTKLMLELQEKNKLVRIEKLDGRFGKLTKALEDWLLEQNKKNNLQLDAIYTGRLFQASASSIAADASGSSSRHLLIHTGGLQGNRSSPALSQFYPTWPIPIVPTGLTQH